MNRINLLKDRIYNFLYQKSNDNIIELSFCDSKIILLYIYLYNLLPSENTNITKYIKQIRNNKVGNNDNKTLIEETFKIIKKTLDPKLNNYTLKPESCSYVVKKGKQINFDNIEKFIRYYKLIIFILLGFTAKSKLNDTDNKHIDNFIFKMKNIYDDKFNLIQDVDLESLLDLVRLNPFIIS